MSWQAAFFGLIYFFFKKEERKRENEMVEKHCLQLQKYGNRNQHVSYIFHNIKYNKNN